ncbi:MAG TPA: hypothetical protein DIC51_02140, partial [Coxiellaceae bacterium]|nr:hypothetical protein [Coxiellaceae bacterium]
HPAWLVLSGIVMVVIYFLAESFLPGMGFSAALSSLPFNLIQAAMGAIGGFLIYKSVSAALGT